MDFFKILEKQFFQKIIILFGNKLRVYEHICKQKEKNSLNIALDLIEKADFI